MLARRRFSVPGFTVALCLVAAAGAVLWLLREVAAARGEATRLEPRHLLGPLGACLALGVWQAYRHSRGFGLATLRFRRRWRKRQWVEVFGFGISVSFFGALLGAAISIPQWLPSAAEDAARTTLVNASLGALAGFVGGFAAQFTPVGRRMSR